MKSLIFLFLTIAIVAVSSQQTSSKSAEPKKGAKAAAPPPKGKQTQENKDPSTTLKPKKITMPPAKASNDAYQKCMCQDDIGMDQFKLSKYLGDWFMVDSQAMMAMNPYTGDCMKATLSSTSTNNVIQVNTTSRFSISTLKSSDSMTYIGQGVFNWILKNLTVVTTKVDKDNKKVDEVVSAPITSTLKYVVIDTDYTNYTIVYICGNYSLGLSIQANSKKQTQDSTQKQLIPPNIFLLMSREKKNSTAFDMASIKNTIRKKYSCYHQMNSQFTQDKEACKVA